MNDTATTHPAKRRAVVTTLPDASLPSPAAAVAAPIKLKIVSLDYYLAPPLPGVDVVWSELEGAALDRVPVVRIFGCTPAGQKACLHLHQAFPYLYVPYADDLPQNKHEAYDMVHRIAMALDAALNIAASTHIPPPDPDPAVPHAPGVAASTFRQRVLGAALVRGIPMYGYQLEMSWIKIFLLDPKDVKKAASLMLSGAVLNRKWQPHESHVPYLLQIKIDLNLQGMGWLKLSKAMFRGPLPLDHTRHRSRWAKQTDSNMKNTKVHIEGDLPDQQQQQEPQQQQQQQNPRSFGTNTSGSQDQDHVWTATTVPPFQQWTGPYNPPRQSICDIELDASLEDVLNRHELMRCELKSAGPEVRMVESLGPMWEEERARCAGKKVPDPVPSPDRNPTTLGEFTEQYRDMMKAAAVQRQEALKAAGSLPGSRASHQSNGSAGIEPEGQHASGPDGSTITSSMRSLLLSIAPPANGALLVSQLLPSCDTAPSSGRGEHHRATQLGGRSSNGLIPSAVDLVDCDILATQIELENYQQQQHRGSVERSQQPYYDQNSDDERAVDGVPSDIDDADDADEPDMLLALAAALGSTQQQQQQQPGDVADNMHIRDIKIGAEGQGAPLAGGFASQQLHQVLIASQGLRPGSSQGEAYLKRQVALERYRSATQKECNDILECSLMDNNQTFQQEQPQAELEWEPVRDKQDKETGSLPATAEEPNLSENKDSLSSDCEKHVSHTIPQIDGTCEEHDEKGGGNKAGTELYVSSAQVRAASQMMNQMQKLLADPDPASFSQPAKTLEADALPEIAVIGPQQQQHGLVATSDRPSVGSLPSSGSSALPPTQPIQQSTKEFPELNPQNKPNNTDDNNNVSDRHAVVHEDGELQFIAERHHRMLPHQHHNGDWWDEDVSAIQFTEDDWDLLDPLSWPEHMNYNDKQPAIDPDAPVIGWRFRHPAPTAAALKVSCWDVGVPPIIHRHLHYGHPQHASKRPVTFANREFRIPTSDIEELPSFTTRPGEVSIMQQLHDVVTRMPPTQQHQGGVKLHIFRPICPPPPPKVVSQLLQSQQGRGAPLSCRGFQGSGVDGRAWAMDATTGRFIPVVDQSQEGDGSDGDLLNTPALPSLPLSSGKYRGSRSLRSTTMTPPALIMRDKHKTLSQAQEEIRTITRQPRPSSPKYDERSFFFSNPFAAEGRMTRAAASHGAGAAADLPATALQDNSHIEKLKNAENKVVDREASQAITAPALPIVLAVAKNPTSKESARRPTRLGEKRPHSASQISAPTPPTTGRMTPASQLGFKRTVAGKGEGLTLLSIEVHADCRKTLLPNPAHDAIRVIAMSTLDDDEEVPNGDFATRVLLFDGPSTTCIAPDVLNSRTVPPAGFTGKPNAGSTFDALHDVQVQVFKTEIAMIDAFLAAVHALDPDILLGFDIQSGSLGYIAERAAAALNRPHLLRDISRMPEVWTQAEGQDDAYGRLTASGLHVAGRVVLNTWRIMKSELKLNMYSLESCAAAVLRLRVPHIPHHQLAAWFIAGPAGGRWRCVRHIALHARLSLSLLDRLDVIGRTSELARTFGIDFYSVLSRGSQYRVESMTLRLAHTQNYIAVAPSAEQVARQPAMEALPLVMEPDSNIYTDPVVVLDFQSLYPSMIIAYNLCYTTCVGRIEHIAGPSAVQLGCTEYSSPLLDPAAVDDLIIAPNGVAFVPPSVRTGVLPRLLKEILDTRIMVKGAMKRAPPSARVLLRCLNARQFGLKLIANVTYGYTAAGFSGRMPMAELADAIVQSGRETLEAAIRLVEAHPQWRARVVYGDTDSLFVMLPGRSKEEAFKVGAEIAATVTAANPPPVTLKMEKVYQPCALLSKKRYVGAMYESPDQHTFTFDAKGIETVRRDTCPAVAKIMERCLRTLFATADLSAVRHYLERQWDRILANRVSVADFVFAKEVRLGTYSSRAASIPPAALVATRAMAADPRAAPKHGERVPYVVVYGDPGARLIDMVVPPRALVESGSGGKLRLHALYYITKQIIPALERVFSLVGADVRAWFAELPRPQRQLPHKRPAHALPLPVPIPVPNAAASIDRDGQYQEEQQQLQAASGTIDRFYLSRHCAVCDSLTHASRPLCEQCLANPLLAAAVLTSRCNRLERQYVQLVRVCLHCGGAGGKNAYEGGLVCDSLACGIYYERRKVWQEKGTASRQAAAGLNALDDW